MVVWEGESGRETSRLKCRETHEESVLKTNVYDRLPSGLDKATPTTAPSLAQTSSPFFTTNAESWFPLINSKPLLLGE